MSDTIQARPRRTAPVSQEPFSSVTWASIGNTFGRTTYRLGWTGQHDLAVQLWQNAPHFDYETACSAVEAAASHLPVHITWETPFGDQVEVASGHAIIEHIVMSPTSNPRLRIAYLGFDHYVHASQVRSITQVGVTRTYEPRKEEVTSE